VAFLGDWWFRGADEPEEEVPDIQVAWLTGRESSDSRLNVRTIFLPLRQAFEGRRKANQRVSRGFGPNGCGQFSIFGCLRAKLNC
jgi:hypothetical protein